MALAVWVIVFIYCLFKCFTMFEPIVEIHDIMEIVGDFKRPFVEASAILKSKHLMECGITSKTSNQIRVMALCLQTSHLDGKPHQIDIKINVQPTTNEGRLICTCTCKAGSGKCKHVVAVLLYLSRTPQENLEDLSCTDIAQQWGKVKSAAKKMYEPVPASKFCHVDKKPWPYHGRHMPIDSSPELDAHILNFLLDGAPESSLSLHLKKRKARSPVLEELDRTIPQTTEQDRTTPQPTTTGTTIKELAREVAVPLLASSNYLVLESSEGIKRILATCAQQEIAFYNKNVVVDGNQSINICMSTIGQVGSTWEKYRKVRITGSICYGLYTYNKPSNVDRNWDNKLEGIYFSQFQGNAFTTYGKENEPLGIEAYERQTNTNVVGLGLIVNPLTPWLGYSPDGVVPDKETLIEVKCLKAGKHLGGLEMAKQAKCLNVNGNVFTLKSKHKYYGQVQLGMLLTDLKECDFVLYSKANNDCLIVNVPFDNKFCQDMLQHLQVVYFKRVLPFLALRTQLNT